MVGGIVEGACRHTFTSCGVNVFMDVSMRVRTLYYNNTGIEAHVLAFVGGGVEDSPKGLAELDSHFA